MKNTPVETAAAPPRQSLLVELDSILEPINTAGLFPKAQPLEVELGCGDGSFLINYARQKPESNFLGVERLTGRIKKVDRKARRAGLVNVRGLRIESTYFLRYLLPPQTAAALHIYFPDPWPKRKHWGNRLVDAGFPALARRELSAGGTIYLRTDAAAYFKQMRQVFDASPEFRAVETPEELAAVKTDFEMEFNARGIPTLLAAYQLVSN
jgi:tRNA (guanine-N7-)-methyltransferase